MWMQTILIFLLDDNLIRLLEGFVSNDDEHLVFKLKKFIYCLKRASRQLYLKFHETISSFGFVENPMDQCIYYKVNRSKICFLICMWMIYYWQPMIRVFYMRRNNSSLKTLIRRIRVIHLMSFSLRSIEINFQEF